VERKSICKKYEDTNKKQNPNYICYIKRKSFFITRHNFLPLRQLKESSTSL